MEFSAHIPLVALLGIELVRFSDGTSELAWTPKPEHLNSFGVLHGGAIMTLLDVTLAHAARGTDASMGVVTIEMKTSFMQPAVGPVSGHGKLLHRTHKTAFVEGHVADAEGRICAHATGTFRYVKHGQNATVPADPVNGQPGETAGQSSDAAPHSRPAA